MGEGRMSMGELSGTESFFENTIVSPPRRFSISLILQNFQLYAIDHSLSWAM